LALGGARRAHPRFALGGSSGDHARLLRAARRRRSEGAAVRAARGDRVVRAVLASRSTVVRRAHSLIAVFGLSAVRVRQALCAGTARRVADQSKRRALTARWAAGPAGGGNALLSGITVHVQGALSAAAGAGVADGVGRAIEVGCTREERHASVSRAVLVGAAIRRPHALDALTSAGVTYGVPAVEITGASERRVGRRSATSDVPSRARTATAPSRRENAACRAETAGARATARRASARSDRPTILGPAIALPAKRVRVGPACNHRSHDSRPDKTPSELRWSHHDLQW